MLTERDHIFHRMFNCDPLYLCNESFSVQAHHVSWCKPTRPFCTVNVTGDKTTCTQTNTNRKSFFRFSAKSIIDLSQRLRAKQICNNEKMFSLAQETQGNYFSMCYWLVSQVRVGNWLTQWQRSHLFHHWQPMSLSSSNFPRYYQIVPMIASRQPGSGSLPDSMLPLPHASPLT